MVCFDCDESEFVICDVLIGKDLGHAFDIPRPIQENTFFAHVCLKSCDVQVNFGAQPFKFTPVCLPLLSKDLPQICVCRRELCLLIVHRKNVSYNLK
jgi:hypothetical protein